MTRFRFVTIVLVVFASCVVESAAWAQAPAQRLGVTNAAFPPNASPQLDAGGGTPRWVKWGIAGAVGGGILFAVAGQSNPDRSRSVAGDAALGAVVGFAVIGGGIALYDWVCGPNSSSRRAGLCGR